MHVPDPPDRAWLEAEIDKRKPWYQCIEFPAYGLTTTSREEWIIADGAVDNLFPGMKPEDAPRLRPIPKFERLARYLPDVQGRTVLDAGCNCGFFAFEFVKRGAQFVTGLDLHAASVERAQFCASVLGIENARFAVDDIGGYSEGHDIVWGASLHEHFFFPFYYLARLICLARELFILETHHYVRDDRDRIARLDTAPRRGAHAFHFSRAMYRAYLNMLGIEDTAIEERVFYDDGVVRRLLLLVDTRAFQQQRPHHHYLQPLAGVGQAGPRSGE